MFCHFWCPCASHYAKHWRYIGEQNKHDHCDYGVHMQMRKTKIDCTHNEGYKRGIKCHLQMGMYVVSGFHLVCIGWLRTAVG